MKEIKLKADMPFHNNVDVNVMDFPQGYGRGEERKRCGITVEFAEYDVEQLKKRGMDFDAAMDYYKSWLYDTIKVNLGCDFTYVEGQDDVMAIIYDHVRTYY